MNTLLVNHGQSISERLDHIRKDDKFSDLTFICSSNNQSYHINAHKIIFSTLSAHLSSLFEIVNHTLPYEKVYITIESFECNIIEKLMQVVYEGQTLISEKETYELFQLCNILRFDNPTFMFNRASIAQLRSPPDPVLNEITNHALHAHWAQASQELETDIKVEENINSDITCRSNTNETPDTNFEEIAQDRQCRNNTMRNKIELIGNLNFMNKSHIDEEIQIVYSKVPRSARISKPQWRKCTFCERKGYMNETLMKYHILYVHDKIIQIHCKKCPYYGLSESDVITHFETVHKKRKRKKSTKDEREKAKKEIKKVRETSKLKRKRKKQR